MNIDLAPAPATCSPVVELRQYTLHPGRRDELIALFDDHFIEGQERCGMRVIGTFCDRADPDRFVWLRGFSDMEARRAALEEFYGGPVWRRHRDSANDTMIDSSNVLLLRPARPGSGFRLDEAARPEDEGGIIIAAIDSFAAPVDGDLVGRFERDVATAHRGAGAELLAVFATEANENSYPRLPVRVGENVLVWLASFADEAAYAGYRDALERDPARRASLAAWRSRLTRPEEVLALTPTRRSQLRHSAQRLHLL